MSKSLFETLYQAKSYLYIISIYLSTLQGPTSRHYQFGFYPPAATFSGHLRHLEDPCCPAALALNVTTYCLILRRAALSSYPEKKMFVNNFFFFKFIECFTVVYQLSIHSFNYSSIHLFTYPSIHLSIYLFTYPSIYSPIHVTIHIFIYQSILPHEFGLFSWVQPPPFSSSRRPSSSR